MSLRNDITSAIKNQSEIDFEFVRLNRYQEILKRIAERFLAKGCLSLTHIWLWEEFRHTVCNTQPPDVIAAIKQRLLPTERYWFLASEEDGKYWVANATGSGIISTLKEMYPFEYYIVDRTMNWILCENHHGLLIEATGTPLQG
ncbi:MAG: DUF6756 family protein [Chthoniobacteraceae bacterium]